MILTLERQPATDGAVRGSLFRNGVFWMFTLEREAVMIPFGRFRVKLTVSGRAQRGELWTPDIHHRLPEICDVPGRTGIRLHAFNTAAQSLGCPGVAYTATVDPNPGDGKDESSIGQSRAALSTLVAALDHSERLNTETWIDIIAAPTPEMTRLSA